ncbi:MAG: S9 family peptidase [Bacteroidota bacterium]|nr:S9 family peptidase [Bacteroidota bacterium]
MLNKIVLFLATSAISLTQYLPAQPAPKKIQIDDAVSSRLFYPKTIDEIRSMKDGEHYTVLDDEKYIIRHRYADGRTIDTLFSADWKQKNGISDLSGYEFSNNEEKILISTNEESIYRHSFVADYYLFDIKTKTLKAISQNGKQQLANLSPAGDKVAFVRDNNIYIVDLKTWKETQITNDGKFNEIINGAPDWVYEEEFSFSKGFEWSPDGLKLAYMRFDESRVKMYTLPIYNDLYPTLYSYKYPKAGEENSVVSVHVFDFGSQKTSTMDVGKEKDQYIPRIKWSADAAKLCILQLNRLQNKIDVLLADAVSGKSNKIYSDSNKYFISQVTDNFITFMNDQKHFLVFSERDGFNHLYRYSMDGKLVNQVTKGNFDIDELLGINQKSGTIYFTSTESSPLERDVYVIGADGLGKLKLSKQRGFNKAEFSHSFKYFINTWSDANTPPQTTLYSENGNQIRTLEDNKDLATRINEFGFVKKEFITIPTSDNILLNAYAIKPAGFDPSKKYPVFMYVYGGPESQIVKNEWDDRGAWFELLAQKGYMVVCVDNRGTDGRGETFKKCTYMRLGKLETEDQLNAARYLASLPYVDGARIGIFGWSYGGYMSSLCMTKGNGLFRMGIAVAPVTNWRFYDSVYTERFMRTPEENPKGYDNNSPINFADKLTGKFLLIHGSADDNVHLQNSMVFSEKLIQAGKDFDMAIYPDKNHSIYGGNTRSNLYKKMTEFISSNL